MPLCDATSKAFNVSMKVINNCSLLSMASAVTSVSTRAARTGEQPTVKLNCSLIWFQSSGGHEWVIMCSSTTFPALDVIVIHW